MEYNIRDEHDFIFGRENADGNIDVLYVEDGYPVTRLDIDDVYPVGSTASAKYEHADGIIIDRETADRIGLNIER